MGILKNIFEKKNKLYEGVVISDAGKIRDNNEDNYYLFGRIKNDMNAKSDTASVSSEFGNELVAVFDGVGGASCGEVASFLSASAIKPCRLSEFDTELMQNLNAVNARVLDYSIANGIVMGSTFAGIYFDDGKAISVNLGDSRTYLFRGNMLKQLSKDQTQGQKLIDAGIMSFEEAKASHAWHTITQHFGIDNVENVLAPYKSDIIELEKGDIFLLCSDGLTDMVPDEMIASIISTRKSAQDIAKALKDKALDNGGKDNVTVLVVKVCK